jgi:hypothetical protein
MDDALRAADGNDDEFEERTVGRRTDDQKSTLVVVFDLLESIRVRPRMPNVRVRDTVLSGTRKNLHIVNLVLTIYDLPVKRPVC